MHLSHVPLMKSIMTMLQYGHGLFGSPTEVETSYLVNEANNHSYVLGAVSWIGELSCGYFFGGNRKCSMRAWRAYGKCSRSLLHPRLCLCNVFRCSTLTFTGMDNLDEPTIIAMILGFDGGFENFAIIPDR